MEKKDLKKEYAALYKVPANKIAVVDVPELSYLACSGEGNPNTSSAFTLAVEALFTVAYTIKFNLKNAGLYDYGVMPLEGLWWADDMDDYINGNRDKWKWRLLIMQPHFITRDMVSDAIEKAKVKKGLTTLDAIEFTRITEGRSAQLLHTGPYSDEGDNIQRLHHFIKENGGSLSGQHHEIYLSDMRRTAPEKLKTIIRQPMK